MSSSCRVFILCYVSFTPLCFFYSSFFFTHAATTAIYTLSLHDALPISPAEAGGVPALRDRHPQRRRRRGDVDVADVDRKSTRLNSSHVSISYAVFCLKKKKYRNSLWFASAMRMDLTSRCVLLAAAWKGL